MPVPSENPTAIANLPACDRPRERLHESGAEALSSVELLALLVGSGSAGRSALDVARDLLCEVGSLPELGRLDPAALARRRGIGASRAARIQAALELGKRSLLPALSRPRIESPAQAAELLMPQYQGRDREHFGVLLLDARNGLIARRTIAIGSLNASLVHPREVFHPAVVLRAARIVLFHNHPSGDPTPSAEDVALTRRLTELGTLLGIEVVDHIVLGDGRYESVRMGRGGTWSDITGSGGLSH